MQYIMQRGCSLKAADSEISEIKDIYIRLMLAYGKTGGLIRLYDFYRIRWREVILRSCQKKFKIHFENQEGEGWLIKDKHASPQQALYIAWVQRNFILICEQSDIPARQILHDMGENSFISEHVLKKT